MAYTPINLQVFVAAMSGAIAGLAASGRNLTRAGRNTYAGNASVAGAFAQALDTSWNSASANQYDIEAIEDIVEGVFAERYVLARFPNLTPGSWTSLANEVVALVRSGDTYMAGQGITPPAIPSGGVALALEQNGVPLAGNPYALLNVTSPGGSVRDVSGVATQRFTTPYAVVYRQGAVSTDSVFGTWAEIKALLAICEVPLTIICDGVNVGGVCTVPASTGQTDMKGTTVLSAYGSGFALGQALFIEDGASLLNLWGTDWALFVFGTPTIISPIVYTLDVVPWLDHGASWDLGAGSTLPFCEIPAVAPFIPPDDGISFDIFNGAGFESDEPTLGCVQVDRAPGEGAQAGVTVFAVNHTFLLNSIGGAFGGAGFLAIASDSNQRDYIALPLPSSPRNGAPGAIAYPNFTGSFSSASYAFATYTQYNDSLQAPTLNQDYVQGVIDQLKAAIFGGATATSTGRVATRTVAASTVLAAGSDYRLVVAGAGAAVVVSFPNTSTVPAGTTFQTCVLDAASVAAGVTATSLGGATFQNPANRALYTAAPNLAANGVGTVLNYTLDAVSGNWNLAS